MNSTLNKYNNLYQKIASRQHYHDIFDDEYQADEDQSNDIALQALSRNKKLSGPVLYTATFGYKPNSGFTINNQSSASSFSSSSFGSGVLKQQKKTVFSFEVGKQKVIMTEIIQDPATNIKAPPQTRIVEYNLQSKQIKDIHLASLITNLDYFSQFSIKELILNLSQNPLCDNGFVTLINNLPTFTTAESITINLEGTQITDHSLRSLNQISGHLENLKEMKLMMKKTSITEKQSFSLVDTFNNNGIDLEIDCDFEKVNSYATQTNVNIRQNGDMGGSNISNSSATSNISKTNSKLQSKIIDKKVTAAQNAVSSQSSSSNQISIGTSEMNVQPFSSYYGNMTLQQQQSLQQQTPSLQSNLYKQSSAPVQSNLASNYSNQSQQEEDVKRKSPEELAAEKNYEDGYGKGFKILMGLGYKVGKGLGKNDQGITEPVQPQNKSKFKENNQSKSSVDYFESLSKQTQQQQGQQGLAKMVKFEKKSTLIINQKLTDNDAEDESGSPSTSSNSKIEQIELLQKNSSQSKGSANIKQQSNNPSPFPQYQSMNNMYGNPMQQQQQQLQQQMMHSNITTSPFIGNQMPPQHMQYQMQMQMQQQQQQPLPINPYAGNMQLHPSRLM